MVFSGELEEEQERLNIDCEHLDFPVVQIRISVWDDGVFYYRTCQSQKIGWKFMVQLYGNVENTAPGTIVTNFENSINLSNEESLLSIWKEIDPYIDN